MKYNMKYWNENMVEISHDNDTHIYDLPTSEGDMVRIAICMNTGYTRRYYSVFVNGYTVATRCKASNAIRFAIDYLNDQQ